MEKGQTVTIRIDDMSIEGQGIGKADGFVIFVDDAVPGDVVRAELVKVKKSYGIAKPVEVIEVSEARTEIFDCPSLEEGCGGCPYSSIDYSAQLSIKERQIREKLQRIAGLEDPLIRPITGMQEDDNNGSGPFRYRNKAQFPVTTGGIITRKGGIVENLGEPAVGFYKPKSHDIVDCPDCYLQSMAAVAAADALRRFMKEDNITAWDPKWDKGLMRHLIVKTGFSTGEVMVILVINGNGIPNIHKLIGMLDEAIYDAGYSLESVVLSIRKGGYSGKSGTSGSHGGDIMGEKNIVAAGKGVIKDMIGSLEFEISPASFYQVNPVQAKRLYDKVREYCVRDRSGEKPVLLDLYCGVGTIGLYCADIVQAVVGVEAVKEAVIDANRNAVINGIVNARYVCGRAEEILPMYASYQEDVAEKAGEEDSTGCDVDAETAELVRKAGVAVLDPPRAGCRPELLEAVAAIGVDRIIYVSCDPATLARDIKILGELGYEFAEAAPYDMFPWTGHCETIVLLSHKSPDSVIKATVEFG